MEHPVNFVKQEIFDIPCLAKSVHSIRSFAFVQFLCDFRAVMNLLISTTFENSIKPGCLETSRILVIALATHA